ncbi:hypothetical protein [Algoriphagus halophilus]|uniref:Uncharacterized protein n=1 Tax=Algoriphagus halophilus TaxID=226505 RepID=A0A1N6FKM8_9BACT|nr:hypothetical protein [Algoriphagus halophilus]SIN95804.1 hypothetical protein SAMN05444394_2517 [Algoriphagus halophilus]
MKFLFTSLLILLICIQGFSQTQGAQSIFSTGVSGCYSDYYITFHDRGAYEIPDGEHEAVLVVINQGKSECYMAKANVKNGQLVSPTTIQKADGTYIPVARMFKALDQDWLEEQDLETLYTITDGMSNVFQTQEKYHVRLFFHTFIHPDHGGNKKAPPASVLLKSDGM